MNIINNREFVKAWMTMESIDHVAKKFGSTNASMSAKANSLRKKGVKLPAKHRMPTEDTVDDLNAIVAKYTKR